MAQPDSIREMGSVDNVEVQGSNLVITGWAYSSQQAYVALQAFINGQLFDATLTGIPRGDVAKAYPDLANIAQSGFIFFIPAFHLLPGELKIEIKAATEKGVFELVNNRRSVQIDQAIPRQEEEKRYLQPLTVHGTGRCGTTLLMNFLSQHPDFVLHNSHPFEGRIGTYIRKVFSLLNATSDLDSYNQSRMFEIKDNLFVGPNPFNNEHFPVIQEAVNDSRHEMMMVERDCVQAIYSKMARLQGKETVKYYAEKTGSLRQIPALAQAGGRLRLLNFRYTYNNDKNILLIRDPRDIFLSIFSFSKKNNNSSWGVTPEDSRLDYLTKPTDGFPTIITDLHRAFLFAKRHPDYTVVRYEDLLLNPKAALESMFAWLEVESGPALIDRIVDHALTRKEKAHVTSSSIQDSRYRWEKELTPEEMDIFQTRHKEILSCLGYPV